ncbi:MAG: response regulator [Ignavibacteriales bacterium]|nr:MAG: response regulator [Ignavibacteriales bacterium]
MNNRILFVDDDESILEGYKRSLRSKFLVSTNSNPLDALSKLKNADTFSVVVSDYKMPVLDGITFLSQVKEISPDTIRIILTGYADITIAINAVNEGNVFRFLTKPLNSESLINALNSGVEQYRLITAEKELLNRTLKGSIKVLIDILSAVNPTAFRFASDISRISKSIAERLKMKEVWEVELAALLSQIGCVTIPQELIEKRISGIELTVEENRIYSSHPTVGSSFLQNIPRLEEVSNAIKFQMKRYDQQSEETFKFVNSDSVLKLAGILKVASDFDAYIKSGLSEPEALKLMDKDKGKYNPEIMSALESEMSGVGRKFMVKNLNVSELRDGMILGQDIYDSNNFILLRKGIEINSILNIRLLNLATVKKIVEPIKVLVPI